MECKEDPYKLHVNGNEYTRCQYGHYTNRCNRHVCSAVRIFKLFLNYF